MNSKALVDRELLSFFKNNPPVLRLDAENLNALRTSFPLMQSASGGADNGAVTVTKKTVAGPAGSPDVDVFIYQPKKLQSGPLPAVLHIHGGGYVLGTAHMRAGQCRRLAEELNCLVMSVDYRLAPETRFPGAVEDCYAALLWLNKEHQTLGINPSAVAILGESAGGGLAASLAFLIRDRREVSIVLQFLTYPMLDDRTGSTNDPGPFVGEFIWPRETNRFGWSALLGQAAGSESVTYPSVPARVFELTGLAPVCIAVGSLDLLAKEAGQYAMRLIEQGVPTELHVYPGAFHGFDSAVGSALSKRFLADQKQALLAAFSGAMPQID